MGTKMESLGHTGHREELGGLGKGRCMGSLPTHVQDGCPGQWGLPICPLYGAASQWVVVPVPDDFTLEFRGGGSRPAPLAPTTYLTGT